MKTERQANQSIWRLFSSVYCPTIYIADLWHIGLLQWQKAQSTGMNPKSGTLTNGTDDHYVLSTELIQANSTECI